MRYTTARFNETAYLPGEFQEGLSGVTSGVTIALFDMSQPLAPSIPLLFSGCEEISGTRVNGFSTYVWPTSGITNQPTAVTQYLYVMRDPTTLRVHKGKIVLGGHPDDTAIQRFNGGVSIDTVSGEAGVTFPIGTPERPVSNLADALSIRSMFTLPRVIRVRGNLTLSGDLTRFAFEGQDPLSDRVTSASGCVLNGAGFERLTVAGDFTASPSGIVGSEVTLGVTGGTISGLRGLFLTALVRGTLRPVTSLIGLDISTDEAFGVNLDFAGAPVTRVAIGSVIGSWNIVNSAGAGVQVGIGGNGARIALASSVTGGIFVFSGVGELSDDATAYNALTDTLVRGTRLDTNVSLVPGLTWDETLAAHLAPGSTGAALAGIASGVSGISGFGAPPSAAAIADAVWDESLAAHQAPGSTGQALSGILSGVAFASGALVFISGFGAPPSVGAIADGVWDELLAGHTIPGSAGDTLANISGSVATPATIADAVWDEAITDHVASGSTGRNLFDARRHVTNDRAIDRTTTPWNEVVYGDDGEEIQRATLSGGDASVAAITNANRPQGVIVSVRHVVSGAA